MVEMQPEIPQEAINESIAPIIQPLVERAHEFLGYTEYFLGGLFGLYLIFFIIQAFMNHKKNKLLKEIKEEIKQVSQKLDIVEDKNK